MKTIFTFIILILTIAGAQAQDRVIKGSVKDVQENPIIGATIVVTGTTNGTVTDPNGAFQLHVDDKQNELTVSFIGYKSQVVKLTSVTNDIAIILQEDDITMEEVVVVGYGAQKKVSITGAISSINNETLKSTPVSSVTNALAGNISGITAVRSSGRPGQDNAELNIRGISSFNNTSPLVLVDGIERDFSQVDPEDIDNVSVLKDASATAVYGVRGANGVILVTTKRGNESGLKASLSTEVGYNDFINEPKYLPTYMSAELSNILSVNDCSAPFWTDYDIERWRLGDSQATHFTGNSFDLFKPGMQSKYNVNLSGGGKKTRYFVSLGYFKQGGNFETDLDKIYSLPYMQDLFEQNPGIKENLPSRKYDPEFGFKRLSFRSNIDIELTQKSSISLDLSYITTTKEGPGPDNQDLYPGFYQGVYTFPWITGLGTFGADAGRLNNPIESINYQGYRNDYITKLQSTLEYNLNLDAVTKGLKLKAKASYDAQMNSYRHYQIGYGLYNYNMVTGKYSLQNNTYRAPSYTNGQGGEDGQTYAEVGLNYSHSFKKHQVGGLLLANISSNKKPNTSVSMYGNIPQVYQGIVIRANYEFDNKYLLEVNAGYNGSNRFAKGHRYAFFPATSVGWIATQESFLQDNRTLTFLKLRASVGQVGNDNLGGFQYYYDTLWSSEKNSSYYFGENPLLAKEAWENQIGNENITWEKATKYNVGIETKWFEKLSFNADDFYDKRKDILRYDNRYPQFIGVVSLSPSNIGVIENKGFEMELGWNQKINKFRYFVRLLGSFARNKIVENGEAGYAYAYQSRIGQSLGQSFLYKTDGIFNSWEEVSSWAYQSGAAPGHVKIVDANKDGIIDDYDVVPVGYPSMPEINYSGRFGFDYKGFDVSVLFQGVKNVSTFDNGVISGLNGRNWSAKEYFQDQWTPEKGSPNNVASLILANASFIKSSDYYLKDGSYLRLKNVEVGYTLPSAFTKKIKLDKVRLYANGFNLYTWRKNDLYDPETVGNGYLQTMVINGGININF